MIRLAVSPDLSVRERYGLEVLVDLSRLLVVEDPAADVVHLVVGPSGSDSFDRCLREGPTLERRDREVRIGRDVLGYVTDVAGAGAEQLVTAIDRHGRVPTENNPLVRAGRDREPVIQRWAIQLRTAVQAVADRRPVRVLAPWPDGHRWAAALTHDLDVVAGWPVFALARAAELAWKFDLSRASRVLGAAIGAIGRNPVRAGVRFILDAEQAARIPATWFVLCGTPSSTTWLRGDLTYTLESRSARLLLDDITRAGHEIGLHGSFGTTLDLDRLRGERARLGHLLGSPPSGVRQHFLRMRPGQTQAIMQAAGFRYDSTYGFPDRNGFRLGVADIVPAWPVEGDSSLEAVPLVWMDRALSKYRGIEDPAAWIADALALAAACRDVEGLWVGLWHPNLTPALGFPGAPDAWGRLLRGLTADHPFCATLERIVGWRRSRRAVRGLRVAPDGRAELVTTAAGDWSVTLEDQQGRAIDSPVRPAHRG